MKRVVYHYLDTMQKLKDRLSANLIILTTMANKKMMAEGLLATCIQHEVDHLNGVLFIDYLSKLKKDMIIKKLVKQKKKLIRLSYKSNGFKINFYGIPRICCSNFRGNK